MSELKVHILRVERKQVGALCFKETPVLYRVIRAQDNREKLPERPDAESVAIWIIRVQPWMERKGEEEDEEAGPESVTGNYGCM